MKMLLCQPHSSRLCRQTAQPYIKSSNYVHSISIMIIWDITMLSVRFHMRYNLKVIIYIFIDICLHAYAHKNIQDYRGFCLEFGKYDNSVFHKCDKMKHDKNVAPLT